MRRETLLIPSILVLISTGCHLVPRPRLDEEREHRLWLVMVWINADSGGDPHEWILTDNLEQMDETRPDPSIHLVTQINRCGSDPYDGAWQGTRRYVFHRPGVDPLSLDARRLPDPPHRDRLSDGQTLVDFVRWATEQYPATHRMLVIQAHGSGWQGLSPAHLRQDPTDLITIGDGELGGALEQMAEFTSIDVLVLDACLMGMWETGWATRDAVRWVVTSEEIGGPLLGSWQDLVPRLEQGPDDARLVCSCIPGMLEGERTKANAATRTCLDMTHQRSLSQAVNAVAEASLESPPATRALVRAVEASLHFSKPDHRDLGDMARLISADTQAPRKLREAADALLDVLGRYVVRHESSPFVSVGSSHGVCGGEGYWGDCGRSTGVAIWAPLSPPPHLLETYEQGPWCETLWDEALGAMSDSVAEEQASVAGPHFE